MFCSRRCLTTPGEAAFLGNLSLSMVLSLYNDINIKGNAAAYIYCSFCEGMLYYYTKVPPLLVMLMGISLQMASKLRD